MWKLRWNSKNTKMWTVLKQFLFSVATMAGVPYFTWPGGRSLGLFFGVDLWDRCVSGRGHHFFCSSVEIVETFFCFGGAKVFIRQMKRLVKEMIARGEWADKTSRRFRRLNLSLFSIFWKLITSFVICREFF